MAETNETIADIIAEMRIGVNALQKHGAKPRNRDEWMVFLAMFADRIESAYKREVGNAAKLREAVRKILWCLEWMFNNTDDKSVQSHLCDPIALARAALAEPARNCDGFGGDPKRLHDEWWKWSGDPRNCNEDGTVKMTYGEWLLEKAKGEKDGSK